MNIKNTHVISVCFTILVILSTIPYYLLLHSSGLYVALDPFLTLLIPSITFLILEATAYFTKPQKEIQTLDKKR